jgi:type IX secretion system PorP/SprF family membrane protein
MMKKYNKITLILLFAVAGMQGVNAQDVGFSQFYANPLYLNPAFAGSKVAPRIALSYRAQWPGLVSAFSTVSASYDQYVNDMHGGIGAILLSDRQGDHGMLNTNLLAAMYSFRFQVHEDIFVNLALQAGVVNMNLNWDPNIMRWPDQIDANCGWINLTSATPPDNRSKFYPDFAAGAMIYGPAWYAGFAAHHLNQPSQGFYAEDRVPMKFTANAGGLINLSEERRRQSSLGLGTPVISPNFIYQYQGGFHYFNYGLYLDWMPFLVGAWFRHSTTNVDAFIFMVGAQHDHFKVGYSYDVTLSEMGNSTLGSHELTVGILLPVPEQKHKIKAIRCPSF